MSLNVGLKYAQQVPEDYFIMKCYVSKNKLCICLGLISASQCIYDPKHKPVLSVFKEILCWVTLVVYSTDL